MVRRQRCVATVAEPVRVGALVCWSVLVGVMRAREGGRAVSNEVSNSTKRRAVRTTEIRRFLTFSPYVNYFNARDGEAI